MRLFIAINLPVEIKEKIAQAIAQINVEKIPDNSNFRWASQDNWHLTISFLGEQPVSVISAISESIKKTAEKFPAPFIEFEKIIFAPPNKPTRMIWLTGSEKTSKTLGKIKNKLENRLMENKVKFQKENRPFNAHLTLARFQSSQQNNQNKLSNYPIPQLSFIAQSMDLMESYLSPSGAEYEILKRVDFI